MQLSAQQWVGPSHLNCVLAFLLLIWPIWALMFHPQHHWLCAPGQRLKSHGLKISLGFIVFKNCSYLQEKLVGKQDGLAVCVNFYTPDISAFTETRLNSGIINYHIIHNSTSYKGEEGEIVWERGYCIMWGDPETCLDISDNKIYLSLQLVSGLLGSCLKVPSSRQS